jgi:SOS response regulatory protein OraA/RecX
VDGRPWRTVPDEVVARCGLEAGIELERPLLRLLRAELRKAEALTVAGRALARRDLSRRRLSERLERAGVTAEPRRGALAALADAGAIDDARVAKLRAASLAERGWGNAAIAERLQAEGLGEEEIRGALAEIPPEPERAARLADPLPDPRKAWTLLARRGFDPDAIEAVLGALDEPEGGGLG